MVYGVADGFAACGARIGACRGVPSSRADDYRPKSLRHWQNDANPTIWGAQIASFGVALRSAFQKTTSYLNGMELTGELADSGNGHGQHQTGQSRCGV